MSDHLALLVEPDDRGRVPLARIPGGIDDGPYVANRAPDGTITLRPAVAIPADQLQALLVLGGAGRPTRGRPLSEWLAERRPVSTLTDDRIADARRRLAGRRTLADEFTDRATR